METTLFTINQMILYLLCPKEDDKRTSHAISLCKMWEPPLNACFFHLAARPECTSDPECPINLACIQEKCQDPCFTTTCGLNAQCTANNHRALCICKSGYVGDPYTICEERKYFILLLFFYFLFFFKDAATMA